MILPDLPTKPEPPAPPAASSAAAAAAAGGGAVTPPPGKGLVTTAKSKKGGKSSSNGKSSSAKTTATSGVTPSPVPPRGASAAAAASGSGNISKKAAAKAAKAKAAALEPTLKKWQDNATSMGGGKIVVAKAEAKKIIFDMLSDTFRPMNITELFNVRMCFLCSVLYLSRYIVLILPYYAYISQFPYLSASSTGAQGRRSIVGTQGLFGGHGR